MCRNKMPHLMKKNNFYIFLKYTFLFFFGGFLYYGIEIIWRGRSHFSMVILGGVCFIFAGLQNENISWDVPLVNQVLSVESFILFAEFVTGCIVNLWLKMDVWDYSHLPGNILGQVCWQYALAWLPLCVVGIVLDDWLRYWLFGEERPHYLVI